MTTKNIFFQKTHFLFVVFNFYDKILKSVKQIITNEISFQTLTDENFVFLFVFLMGFLVGILAFSKIIDKFIN